ncbi:MAG TPA: hypothetical protein VIC26_13020 [Marinagarivorans sp.]
MTSKPPLIPSIRIEFIDIALTLRYLTGFQLAFIVALNCATKRANFGELVF